MELWIRRHDNEIQRKSLYSLIGSNLKACIALSGQTLFLMFSMIWGLADCNLIRKWRSQDTNRQNTNTVFQFFWCCSCFFVFRNQQIDFSIKKSITKSKNIFTIFYKISIFRSKKFSMPKTSPNIKNQKIYFFDKKSCKSNNFV